MKINEVEAAVGVTKKNIRFYEEEGLITPSREPGNGYRSYSQADVERLRRIKLLRKLDVPLAEIREMLEGQRTLAEGMSQQLERLRSRRADLEEAIGFCTLLQQENGPLEQLDVEQTLANSIKAGGSGKWGPVPMPAQAALSDGDAKLLAAWILGGAK